MTHSPRLQSGFILSLEASGDAASAAIVKDHKISSFHIHHARYGHAQTLIRLVEDAIGDADCSFADISHIIAGCGPGSFTGLRICLAAAKGYVLATGATPIGVNGLSALCYDQYLAIKAKQDIRASDHYLGFADSRRGSVFLQHADSLACPVGKIEDIPHDDLTNYLENQLQASAGGRFLVSGLLPDMPEIQAVIQADNIWLHDRQLDAASIARYGAASLTDSSYITGGFEPVYVVPPKLGAPGKKGKAI